MKDQWWNEPEDDEPSRRLEKVQSIGTRAEVFVMASPARQMEFCLTRFRSSREECIA